MGCAFVCASPEETSHPVRATNAAKIAAVLCNVIISGRPDFLAGFNRHEMEAAKSTAGEGWDVLLELAARLLEVANDKQLDQFLHDLIRKGGTARAGVSYGKAKATTESPRGSSLITRFPPAAITRYCFPFIS